MIIGALRSQNEMLLITRILCGHAHRESRDSRC